MKIAICSDIHLEFGTIELKNPGGVDVLILSGDICVERDVAEWDQVKIDLDTGPRKSKMIHEFFQNCCAQFGEVIYVVGNHEHYHGDFAKTIPELKRKLGYLSNLRILDKETFTMDDVMFIGATLWTDMNKEDPLTLHSISSRMNDFRCVDNSNRMVTRKVPVYEYDENGKVVMEEVGPGHVRTKQIGMKIKETVSHFSPEDAVEDHKKFVEYLRETIAQSAPWMTVVVVGHHAPSKASTHPRYAHETLMNGAYSSDLSEFILDHPQIKLWTHGHTHEDFDYRIGSTRVVCNPRGYDGYESRADRFELKVVEI